MSNDMRDPLIRFLDALENIANRHEEVYDTDVREQMGAVIEDVLVTGSAPLPVPDELGMFSAEGNRLVGEALETYLAEAVPHADMLGLDKGARRAAVWDD